MQNDAKPEANGAGVVHSGASLRIWDDGATDVPDRQSKSVRIARTGVPSETPALILFPGMGASQRMFQSQRLAFPDLIVPDWIEPKYKETLPQYARRLAETIDPGRPYIVGGASFGGMVALEVARYLDTRACVLIASIRSRRELPWRYRWLGPLASTIPGTCENLAGWGIQFGEAVSRPFRKKTIQESPLVHMASEQGRFLRWASIATLRWKPKANAFRFPIEQIHGDADLVLESRLTTPDVVIPKAGHLLTLTHPAQVNQFLENAIAKYSRPTKQLRVVAD